MLKIFNYFGILTKDASSLPYSYTTDEYTTATSEGIKTHRDFLKSIEAEENNRLNLIESKTSQIISQTGVTFALLSLFIPIFTEKIIDQHLVIKTVFIFLLVLSYTFYAITIHNAIKNFNIKKFIYTKPSPINVIKYQNSNIDDFLTIEVKDLLHSININLKTNNQKATNLIYAYNAFRFGNILTAFLSILLCFLLLFSKPDDKSISIDKPVQIYHFDSLMQTLINEINEIPKINCPQDSTLIK